MLKVMYLCIMCHSSVLMMMTQVSSPESLECQPRVIWPACLASEDEDYSTAASGSEGLITGEPIRGQCEDQSEARDYYLRLGQDGGVGDLVTDAADGLSPHRLHPGV